MVSDEPRRSRRVWVVTVAPVGQHHDETEEFLSFRCEVVGVSVGSPVVAAPVRNSVFHEAGESSREDGPGNSQAFDQLVERLGLRFRAATPSRRRRGLRTRDGAHRVRRPRRNEDDAGAAGRRCRRAHAERPRTPGCGHTRGIVEGADPVNAALPRSGRVMGEIMHRMSHADAGDYWAEGCCGMPQKASRRVSARGSRATPPDRTPSSSVRALTPTLARHADRQCQWPRRAYEPEGAPRLSNSQHCAQA